RVDVVDRPGSGRRVAGSVSGPSEVVGGLEVRLVPVNSTSTVSHDSRVARTDAQGRFAFSMIPSGDYRLQVVRFPDAAAAVAAGHPIGRPVLLPPGGAGSLHFNRTPGSVPGAGAAGGDARPVP